MTAPSRRARLVVKNGALAGTSWELAASETLIGRNPTSDVALQDEGISREHAIVLYDEANDAYSVEDLQSTNGTQVNGKRVRSATLTPGDEVRIGRTVFEFVRDPKGA
jgi:pSer/pThr/pTyr-binding forkhead associated (FHA) protein